MKFIADAMLGKLARWMRIMGCDVEYEPVIDDSEIVERAQENRRIILTRDTLLIKRKKARDNHFFVSGDSYKDQIRQVVQHFGLDPFKLILTRCLVCNVLLRPVEKSHVQKKVPPYVFQSQDRFETCPSCNRIYWPATHRDEMVRQLKDILSTH